ncbi:hypothetical protein JOB18_004705 [Solea senegalensis]|uniref:Uncharacterized protein n=1 Tax=Solea senegalensis TaxID=28829 RepID=A0AAV6R9E7_SOLSE|nr:hypothetical protein JOB18_004705 [Solea senegalensis]
MAQLLREFDEYQLNILGISEMRWTGSGKLCSDGKTVLCSGHEDNRQGFDSVVGPTARKTSNNEERLLLFCNINSLNVGNTYFQHKMIHKKTSRSSAGTT